MPLESLAGLGRPGSIPPPFEDAATEHGYPRPMLRRENWVSLNGEWEFVIDAEGLATRPDEVEFSGRIVVPFSPETPRSGVGDTGLYRACWYRRRVEVPALSESEHLLLHFGAVDYCATVFVDGVSFAEHEGGYTPFTVDLSECVRGKDSVVLVLHARDDPGDLAKPRGKQDWQRKPHSIWYPRTTGIWQTVWLERVPDLRIHRIRWTPNLERWAIALEASIVQGSRRASKLGVRLRAGNITLADDTYSVTASEVNRTIALSDPGIDDFRNLLLWSPEVPTLITAELWLSDESGAIVDQVRSYTAIRAVAVQGDRFVLNGRPYPLRLVLDQGYWPETGLTAPDDAALKRDVELAKQMGFNGVRKHQKLEDPRYLYWADRLGLLVWEEMPSAYRFTRRSIERTIQQWLEALERDVSHPCIVCWVPFNESWGVPNLPDIAAERHYVQSVYHLTKSVDPSRPVIGNDGWESSATDIMGIHDYDPKPARLLERYYAHSALPHLLQRERPGGRILVLEGHTAASLPLVLSEFGGIALARPGEPTWGYSRCQTGEELAQRYIALLNVVGSLQLFAGFCYTQFADTYQEANGLLYADRTPKFPLKDMYAATCRHVPETAEVLGGRELGHEPALDPAASDPTRQEE